MNWYHMKRGNVRSRSILSDEQLEMKASAGDLDKSDLLWSDKTDQKWARAGTFPDFFKSEEPAPAPPAKPVTQAPLQKDRNRSAKSALAAVVVSAIAIIAVLLAGKIKNALTPPPLPPPPPPTVETNRWETVDADVRALLAKGEIGQAQRMISDYVEDVGNDQLSASLKANLDRHLKRARMTELYSLFSRAAATPEDMKELVSISGELEETKNLTASLATTLKSKRRPTPDTCRAILQISRIMNDRPLQLLSVEALASVLDVSSSSEKCLDLVNLFIEYKMQDKAIDLLKRFTSANPDSSSALLELSALLAVANQPDDSLEFLKKAVKAGGDAARETARNDPRFDSIRETWTFKWNTR